MFFRTRRESLRLLFKTSLLNISGWLKIEQFQRWERNWYWHSSIATRNDRWMIAKTFGLLWQYRRCSRVRKVNDEQNCSWCVWGDDDHNWNEGRPRDLGNEEKTIDRWSLNSRCQTDKNTSLFVFIGLWTFVPPPSTSKLGVRAFSRYHLHCPSLTFVIRVKRLSRSIISNTYHQNVADGWIIIIKTMKYVSWDGRNIEAMRERERLMMIDSWMNEWRNWSNVSSEERMRRNGHLSPICTSARQGRKGEREREKRKPIPRERERARFSLSRSEKRARWKWSLLVTGLGVHLFSLENIICLCKTICVFVESSFGDN